jgi:hypothetical protein
MIVQVISGILYANLIEWLAHKYILHGLGKKKKSFFSFHWSYHHRISRKLGMYDPSYLESSFSSNRWKEVCGILLLMVIHTPVVFILSYFTIATWVYALLYLYLHKKCHIDVKWCKKYMPWHYRHHLGKNQDSDFNVVFPIVDYLFNTRNGA